VKSVKPRARKVACPPLVIEVLNEQITEEEEEGRRRR